MTEAVASVAMNVAAAMRRPVAIGMPPALAPKEFLTFRVGAQDYGIDAQKVQAIRGCGEFAGADDAPEPIAGAIDLRGASVPTADLRRWFKLERAAEGMFTVAIILNLDGRVIGLMVDSVSDVIRLTRWQIRPASESATGPDAQYLIGVGIDDERKPMLLDIEKLLLDEGMGLLEIGTNGRNFEQAPVGSGARSLLSARHSETPKGYRP